MFETIIGLMIGIFGLVFAFEKPRLCLVSLFRKKQGAIRHEFKVRTEFYAHNDGKPIGPLGTNKTERSYVLTWMVWNQSGSVIQLERGMQMRQRRPEATNISLSLPEHADVPPLFPKSRHELLSLLLTPKETDFMRHWVRECCAFGVIDSSGVIHWIPDDQFLQFEEDLRIVAQAYGLSAEVSEGTPVLFKIQKTPITSLKGDGTVGSSPKLER